MITQKRLKELFHYDELTGDFTRIAPVKKANVGDVAGCLAKNGYITISIDCKRYYAHRLAMLYVYGYMPVKVDHKDRCRSNNKISNLRPATNQLNEANKAKLSSKKCASKYKGVSIHKSSGKWRSRIKVSGREISLGLYDCEILAARAYDEAATKYFGSYASRNEV